MVWFVFGFVILRVGRLRSCEIFVRCLGFERSDKDNRGWWTNFCISLRICCWVFKEYSFWVTHTLSKHMFRPSAYTTSKEVSQDKFWTLVEGHPQQLDAQFKVWQNKISTVTRVEAFVLTNSVAAVLMGNVDMLMSSRNWPSSFQRMTSRDT